MQITHTYKLKQTHTSTHTNTLMQNNFIIKHTIRSERVSESGFITKLKLMKDIVCLWLYD